MIWLDYICLSRYNKKMKLKESQKLFIAFSDNTRLRILNLLSEGELCVCDLMRILKEPQSKVSRHLSYLRRSGFVEARKEGLWMHYRLAKPCSKICEKLLNIITSCRCEFGDLEKDLNFLKKIKSNLVACCN